MERHPPTPAHPDKIAILQFDEMLLELTERDPNGRFLMEHLCELVEEHAWTDSQKWLIYHALELMYDTHGDQGRGNGDAYITHPLRVAIDLSASPNGSAELVAAALLHDTVEDRPFAVITELAQSANTQFDAASTSRGSAIEHAIDLLYRTAPYEQLAHLVDGVTNRAYPPLIDTLSGEARKNAQRLYRARQITQHIERSDEEALLKFRDTYDNVRSLVRHEALNNEPHQLPQLRHLIDKYTLMLNQWKSSEAARPPSIRDIDIAICTERLAGINNLAEQKMPA